MLFEIKLNDRISNYTYDLTLHFLLFMIIFIYILW